jgi:glycine/D-amino acid oxidase-like deaminating enzyme
VIAIVGGGLIGLSAAWQLGRAGVNAVVYERNPEPGQESSWAGAGMLAPRAESFSDALWQGRADESAAMYADFVRDLGGDIDFYPPSAEADGHVDPRDVVRELRRSVRVVQADIHELEELNAGQIVVTAGAWSGGLRYQGQPLPPTVPIKGYMLAWKHLPPGTLEGIRRDGHTYLLQRRHGLLLAGSTEEQIGFDRSIDPSRLEELQRRAEALMPELSAAPPVDSWCGFRPGTPDGYPVLRRLDSRVLLAYGHYRNGILLAPWTARWILEQIQANPST